MAKNTEIMSQLHEAEHALLTELRKLRRAARGRPTAEAAQIQGLTLGQRIADTVAATMGSWTFIIIQSAILAVWIALNITAYVQRWDPYPFILLNLILSMLAAIQAPVIMMSQNRQDKKDRLRGELDFAVNRRAASDIQALAGKLNLVADKVGDLDDELRALRSRPPSQSE